MLTGVGKVTAALTAQNQFTTDTINTVQTSAGTAGIQIKAFFNLSIAGTWVGKLTLQRSYDVGVTWNDINQFTTNVETWDQEIESGILYRVGFKTGDFTSGTANVRISK